MQDKSLPEIAVFGALRRAEGERALMERSTTATPTPPAHGWLRTVRLALSSALIVLGLGLGALNAMTWAKDASLADWLTTEIFRERQVREAPLSTGAVSVVPAAEVSALELESLTADEELSALSTQHSALSTEVAPAPAAPAQRLAIPGIDVDTSIVQVFLNRGEWPVPKFVAGHLGESANPGDIGNAVFAGHLLSLASGNVFSKLDQLAIGDDMTFFSADGPRLFRVIETRLVANTDVSVLAARPGKATVTLITCAGRWIPRDNDYDQRRVVVAEAVTA